MNEKDPEVSDTSFKPDFDEKYKIWLTSQDSLRKLVGILGLALPVLLYIGLLIDTGYAIPLESISHYYFTRVGSIFIIVISLLAIFLIIYKGEKKIDFYLSLTAGIFALVLLLFPTGNIDNTLGTPQKYVVTVLKDSHSRENLHLYSAGIFLMSLAAMSFFLFTKSDKPEHGRTHEKNMRNRLYRTCSIIMALAVGVIACYHLDLLNAKFYDHWRVTFIMETIAVWSFGISWLVKGKTFLDDQ